MSDDIVFRGLSVSRGVVPGPCGWVDLAGVQVCAMRLIFLADMRFMKLVLLCLLM